jgi:hypothetical protein
MQPRANNGNYTMPSTAGKCKITRSSIKLLYMSIAADAFDGLLSFAGPSQNNKTLDPSKLTLAEQQQRMKSSNAAATNAPANGNMYAAPLNSQMGASRQPTVGYFSPPSSNVPFSTVSPGLSPQSAYQLQQQQPPASTAASPAFNRSPVSGLQQQPVAKSVDPFGALLGDLRPGGATQKQPIAAQQTLAAKSAASNAASVSKDQLLFSGLDVLATTTTAGPAAAAAAIGTNKTAASGLDGFDEFFANPAAAAQSSQAPRLAATAAPVDDDPFGLFSSAPSVKAPLPTTSSAAPVAPAKSANTAAISASSLNDNADIAPAVPPKRAVPTESSQERKPVTATDIDKMVSKMVELGFEAGESRDALAANNNSVEQAIEYLFYAKQSSSNNAKQSSMATKITQMTGLKGKNAEKAEKLLSSGFSLLNKAKVMMTDSAKKVSSAIESKTAGGRFGGGNSSRRDIRNGGEYYNYEDETDGEIQQRVRIGNSSSRSSASNSRESVVVDDGIKMKQTPPVPVKKKRSQPPVHCSQQALDAVSQLKDRGNDFFKKGQYGDAEELASVYL